MIRTSGLTSEYKPIEKNNNFYKVRWDRQTVIEKLTTKNELTGETEFTGETKDTNYSNFMLEYFHKKPTEKQIQNMIIDWYNKQIDKNILSGFTWKDMSVWLSTENQFNYKAAYDLAVQTEGATLPVTFKFGTTNNPVYYTFETVTDLTDFYIQAMNYINNCLKEGWEKKDSIDWSIYNIE